MVSRALYFFLLLIHSIIQTTAAAAPPTYTATDLILLNCGDSSNANDINKRTWNGDQRSRYAPPNAAAISTASAASHVDPSVFPVPYERARVFHSPFTYTIPLLSGQKFLRLYFYPALYTHFNTSQSFLNVTANGFTLLSNFSAFMYSKNSSQPSFMKEFVINIGENQKLDLTFSPNPNSSAFVNGIEIVSIRDKLYFKGNDVLVKFGNGVTYLDNATALESLYRLNVGGARVEIQDDSGPFRGMFRAWNPDDDYIYAGDPGWTPHAEDLRIKYTEETPPYSAPEMVYTTSRVMANLTTSLDWNFPVDSGFYYLLRLHFSEFFLEVTEQNERVFTISVDNQIEEIQADVVFWTGGTQIPIFRDYIAYVPKGKKDLWLSLFPNLEGRPKYSSALLNGLEIFKLSDENRSLAAPNPELVTEATPQPEQGRPKSGRGSPLTYAIIGSSIGVLVMVALASFFILWRRRRGMKDSATTSADNSLWIPLSITSRSTTMTNVSGTSLPSDLCRYFPLDEIKSATHNFNDSSVITKGVFGNVYKGAIDGGATTVAIKRLNTNRGAHEFLTEIRMLSKLRHLHLVSLIGYCDEYGEMILVYEYMGKGSLQCHLYNSDNSPLTWKERLRICLGAARGLHYLHTGAKRAVIHRNVKSSNILLDRNCVAKMSNFGLSKVGPTVGAHAHVSTVVKGSFGYVDPEYYRRQQLTDKSDVYSFGVVLFEVLCARPPIILSLPRDQVNLAEWAKFRYRKGTLEQIIDGNLKGQIARESLSKYVKTAVACLREEGSDRPAMSDVVWSLEFAMQLQETAESRFENVAYGGSVEPNTTDEDEFSRSSEAAGSKDSGLSSSSSERLKTGDVFSEIMNPMGR